MVARADGKRAARTKVSKPRNNEGLGRTAEGSTKGESIGICHVDSPFNIFINMI